MTPFAIQPDAMTAAFEAAGFDVNYSDVAVARRDDDKAWEIVIDQSGRLKGSVSFASSAPLESSVPVRGRDAAVLIEHSTVITLVFALQDASELPDALTALEAVVAEYGAERGAGWSADHDHDWMRDE
jgi:hypothetical protein